jgi:hypothetical protein
LTASLNNTLEKASLRDAKKPEQSLNQIEKYNDNVNEHDTVDNVDRYFETLRMEGFCITSLICNIGL